jgi:hypothetical protein
MSKDFLAWDEAAMSAEPALTEAQCEVAITALESLAGHPGTAWLIYYLQGIQRQAGSQCADFSQPMDTVRANQGIYEGLNRAMTAITPSFQTLQSGGVDTDAVAFFRRVLNAKRQLAAEQNGEQS